MSLVSGRLPDFPWDRLTEYADRARSHPDGIVDLSIGTPVDPTPPIVTAALSASADSPGYPMTIGRADTRAAMVEWLRRTAGVTCLDETGVLPTIGSKELIAHLPMQLGLGPEDLIIYPTLAYPTYAVGAALVGAHTRVDSVPPSSADSEGGQRPSLAWINSPGNPTGEVLSLAQLRAAVQWSREQGVLLVSDECYLECYWTETRPRSILDPEICDGDPSGLLSVHSLSKRSNLAGYRCAFVAGDPTIIGELLKVRKNLGLMMPGPTQAAMAQALADDVHVKAQRARYAARREILRSTLESAGFQIDHSEGALYLWATRPDDADCWASVEWLVQRGILVAPGDFYGAAGRRHVRVAFTATDERVAAAAARLSA